MIFVELPTVSQVSLMSLPIFWMLSILKLLASTGVSTTITSCEQFVVLPCTSVTVQTTSFVPGGKLVGALLVTLATPQLSPVTGVPNSMPLAQDSPTGLVTVTSAGQMIVGSWAE